MFPYIFKPRKITLLLAFAICGCAAKPLTAERQKAVDIVSVASFLGNRLAVDVQARTLLAARGSLLDIRAWNIDATFQSEMEAGAIARGKKFLPLALNEAAVNKALNARESRWQKTLGKYNQALLDELFRAADAQGVQYLFLSYPLEALEHFPQHRGPLGIYCNNQKDEAARAYAYFIADFSLWDLKERKKIFQYTLNPRDTEMLTFAECGVAAVLKEPVRELEDPVKRTMGLVVEALFEKMGWKVSAQP